MQLFCPAVPVVHDRIVRDGSQDCSHGSTDMIRSMRGVLREAHAFLFAPRMPLWLFCLLAFPVALVPSVVLLAAAEGVLALAGVDASGLRAPGRHVDIEALFSGIVLRACRRDAPAGARPACLVPPDFADIPSRDCRSRHLGLHSRGIRLSLAGRADVGILRPVMRVSRLAPAFVPRSIHRRGGAPCPGEHCVVARAGSGSALNQALACGLGVLLSSAPAELRRPSAQLIHTASPVRCTLLASCKGVAHGDQPDLG
jgi:hypothetical protein